MIQLDSTNSTTSFFFIIPQPFEIEPFLMRHDLYISKKIKIFSIMTKSIGQTGEDENSKKKKNIKHLQN